MGSLAEGECLLHYRILGKLGQGGMGEVYRAEDTKLGRHVAVKVIAADELRDEKARLRLLREARSVSALNHPNIVTIHAIEQFAGRDFLVMELIEGKDLHRRTRERPLDLDELIEVGTQIAGALAAAHSTQIIHRDIKPANIMLSADGLVKVLDFGLAKWGGKDQELTTAGLVVGTIAYMSPEQLRGEPLDSRTDLFSLGCVLYEAATGRRPFQSDSLPELIQELTRLDPEPPSTIRPELGPGFDRVIQRAMAKDREQRYETAGQLRSELKSLRSDPTVSIARAAAGAQPRKLILWRLR